MTKCLLCEEPLGIKTLSCDACHTTYGGDFCFPRLARLAAGERSLAESLILHGGNLKEMAQALQISYPTLKKQLNALADSLRETIERDDQRIEVIFGEIEQQTLTPQKGIKQIKEIKGEL